MTGSVLILCLSFYQTSVDKPVLKFFQDTFIVRSGDQREDVPVQLPKAQPKLALSFRKNKNYAVWDDRGLTIRVDKTAKSTKLPDIATSPKSQDADSLKKSIELIGKGARKREASALSGARRIGSNTYFLARWVDKEGKTWLEALVSVDLMKPNFHPKFLASLPGSTLASAPIDDQLFMLNGKLACIVKRERAWGMAVFDEKVAKFEFKELGENLESYQPMSDSAGAFVEKTDYGTRIGGKVDLKMLVRKNLIEDRGSLRFLDARLPLIALSNRDQNPRLINTDTGAELELPTSASMRRTKFGVVIWSPLQNPRRAWLYETTRWTPISEWTSGGD